LVRSGALIGTGPSSLDGGIIVSSSVAPGCDLVCQHCSDRRRPAAHPDAEQDARIQEGDESPRRDKAVKSYPATVGDWRGRTERRSRVGLADAAESGKSSAEAVVEIMVAGATCDRALAHSPLGTVE